MDVVTLALCKRIAAGALSGVASMSVEDQTLNIECVDGTHLEMHFPEPVSIVDAEIDENGHLILTLSDGNTIDAGEIPGGEGGGSLTRTITSVVNVGGISSGTTYAVNTPIEDIISDLLEPTLYPTLTNPSVTLTTTGDKLLEVGSTLSTTFTLAFSRGSISPAYGTSGYRSGVATAYLFDGETKASGQFTRVVDATKTSYQGSVSYAAGEQPKDSKGQNYSSPLPAGSVNSNTITYEFVDAMWGNVATIGTIAKMELISKTAKQRDMNFPAQTIANPEVFDIPASWTITAVQVKNDLSGVFEDALSQFTVTDVTHDDAAGTSVAYKRYTCNLGYDTGTRLVRVKWS